MMPQKQVEGETSRRVSVALGRLDGLKLHTLFTFLFTYIGVSVHRNFVLLPVSVASPLNNITLLQLAYLLELHTITAEANVKNQVQIDKVS